MATTDEFGITYSHPRSAMPSAGLARKRRGQGQVVTKAAASMAPSSPTPPSMSARVVPVIPAIEVKSVAQIAQEAAPAIAASLGGLVAAVVGAVVQAGRPRSR